MPQVEVALVVRVGSDRRPVIIASTRDQGLLRPIVASALRDARRDGASGQVRLLAAEMLRLDAVERPVA